MLFKEIIDSFSVCPKCENKKREAIGYKVVGNKTKIMVRCDECKRVDEYTIGIKEKDYEKYKVPDSEENAAKEGIGND